MGRKAIHRPEKLELGERMELKGKLREFSWQYLNNFNKRGSAKYSHIKEGDKVFIERIS